MSTAAKEIWEKTQDLMVALVNAGMQRVEVRVVLEERDYANLAWAFANLFTLVNSAPPTSINARGFVIQGPAFGVVAHYAPRMQLQRQVLVNPRWPTPPTTSWAGGEAPKPEDARMLIVRTTGEDVP